MDKKVIKPYQDSTEGKKEQVEKMFDNISEKYDLLNRMITFGMDRTWRKKVLKLVQKQNPQSILDIATGTGDMPILFSKTNATNIIGVDIAQGMLKVANEKILKLNLQNRISTEVQNAENLEFIDNTFDVVSVAYGIRNFESLDKGLSEIYRVLNKDGVLIILETSQPTIKIFKFFYLFYTKYLMPLIAKLLSKDKSAYQYLSSSAINFPYGSELKKIIEKVNFKSVELYPQFFGASMVYYAKK